MKIAIIGCGYVADYYLQTANKHQSIEIKSVFDIDAERLKSFCNYYSLDQASDMDEILNDEEIELIINLTNPDQHYKINLDCLQSGNMFIVKNYQMKSKKLRYFMKLQKKKS